MSRKNVYHFPCLTPMSVWRQLSSLFGIFLRENLSSSSHIGDFGQLTAGLVNDIHSSVVAVTHQLRPGQWRSAEASAAIAVDVVVEASVAKDAVRLLLKDIFANDHFNCFGSHESSYFTRESTSLPHHISFFIFQLFPFHFLLFVKFKIISISTTFF